MQFNYFLEHRLIHYNGLKKELTINYKLYAEVVNELLAEVLDIQYAGDKERARQFVKKWTQWQHAPHEVLAQKQNKQARYLKTMVRYAALQTEGDDAKEL
jgi:hypothetical protein